MRDLISFMDVFSIAGVVIIWVFTGLQWKKLPSIIPVHFDLQGNPDNFGSKYFIFLLPFVGTVLYFTLGFPVKEIHNYPVKITQENKAIQYTIGLLAVKSIIAYVLFMFFIFQKTIIEIAGQKKETKIPVVNLIIGLFVIIILFIILANIYK